ncbi:hypothetical protein TvY486_0044260 [Trypanosoma vivax Y486]|uniref:Uncharacterized protein n=1 Tax=Trypanosoma vivax (strain Y486) TaxID=1055687 RepID=F9WVA6_TRYVY|nr:hypothetical protein TvY486_0044260 [Trypanosoma vivax Y486]|eukprot:CCD21513.1 hypothetical protein TvY486_0044260 [Trypanosoma vivax Y486]
MEDFHPPPNSPLPFYNSSAHPLATATTATRERSAKRLRWTGWQPLTQQQTSPTEYHTFSPHLLNHLANNIVLHTAFCCCIMTHRASPLHGLQARVYAYQYKYKYMEPVGSTYVNKMGRKTID